MENLIIEQTDTSPKVEFDLDKQTYEIIGRSFPEDPFTFFEPILEYIGKVFPAIDHPVRLIIKTEYLNSASSRYMLIIFRKLAEFYAQGKSIKVIWQYYDEDLHADGLLYQNLVKLPFEFVSVESES
ncbi:MAG TPA: DUF1987 domain-containing protein [Salinivirgaceae bacterium]|nr:DUF1987 domain-containing protein [Salinivirgaceae bacterium]HQA75959.1 DUF1987 domain-containing protein [Salinivirgaceae bacterium]